MRKILILASNPNRDLALDREIRDLEGVVKRSRDRDEFEVKIGSAVRPEDLQELLLEHEPQIVHFCGHGTGEQGLVLQNSAGRAQLVSTSALSSLFKLFTGKVECVLLNACYSEVQANAISQHVNYVIGMSQTILDDAAIAFATGFYRGLGYGRTTDEAYHFGCNAIELMPSTTVISRSPTAPQERKLTAEFTVIPGAPIAVPEHLKPILKTRQTLAVQSSGVNIPAVPTSETKRVEIAEDVSKALEQEAWLKQYRNCVRDFLADGVLTPEEKLRLGLLAKQLGLDPAEAIAIFQEEERLRLAQVNDRSDEHPISTGRNRSTASAEMLQLISPGARSRPFFQKPLFQVLIISSLVALLGTALKWGHPTSIQTKDFPFVAPPQQSLEADQGHLAEIQRVLTVNDIQTAKVEAEKIQDAASKQRAIDLIAQTEKTIFVSSVSVSSVSEADQGHLAEIQRVLTVNDIQTAKVEAEKIQDAASKQRAIDLIAQTQQSIEASKLPSVAVPAVRSTPDQPPVTVSSDSSKADQAHLEKVKTILQGNNAQAVQNAGAEASQIVTDSVRQNANILIDNVKQLQADQEHFRQVQTMLNVKNLQGARDEAAQIQTEGLQQHASMLINDAEKLNNLKTICPDPSPSPVSPSPSPVSPADTSFPPADTSFPPADTSFPESLPVSPADTSGNPTPSC